MTVKEAIQEIIAGMSDEQAVEVLVYLRHIEANESDSAADSHAGSPRISPDEAALLANAQPFTMDDPLWDLVGIVGDEYDGPTDVSSNKHAYIADAYADLHRK